MGVKLKMNIDINKKEYIMNLDGLINKLLEFQKLGYGNKKVLYDYYGDIQSVQIEDDISSKDKYINLSPID